MSLMKCGLVFFFMSSMRWCVRKKQAAFINSDCWLRDGQINELNALFLLLLLFLRSLLFTWPVQLTSCVRSMMTNGKDRIFIMTMERMNLFSYSMYILHTIQTTSSSIMMMMMMMSRNKATADRRYASFTVYMHFTGWTYICINGKKRCSTLPLNISSQSIFTL
jgi:hypothetical protein